MTTRAARFLWAVLCAVAAALAACGHSPTDPGDGTTILFNLSTSEIVLGDTVQLTATVRDPSGNALPNVTFAWSSQDTKIATVSPDGLVKAVGMGETNIQVDATIPDVAQVRPIQTWWAKALSLVETPVHAAAGKHVKGTKKVVIVPDVKILPEAATIAVGGHQAYSALITYKDGTPLVAVPTIKWDSSDKTIATIDGTGNATGVKNGSTTISATVTVGSATNVVQKVTLKVSDLCDGIASVQTVSGGLNYLYERDGTYQTAKIHSKFNASGLTATLTRDFNTPDSGIAQWKGPVNGTASQVETMAYPTGEPYRLNSTGGAFTVSEMLVKVDLVQCTYRVVTTLAYHVTRTDTSSTEAGVDIVKGDSALRKKTDGYFGNELEPGFPAARNPPFSNPNADAFVVSGFAGFIEGDLGLAQASFTLTAGGTSDRPLVRKASPPSLLALIGNRIWRR